MRIELRGEKVKILAYLGSKTKNIHLYKNKRLVSKLYIQKIDMFSTNLLASINRLVVKEVDEIKYKSHDEEVNINLYNGNLIGLYFTTNDSKKKKLIKMMGE